MEKEIAKIFDCTEQYANKIIASLKLNLPIQGATPEQIYKGYVLISSTSIDEAEAVHDIGFQQWLNDNGYFRTNKSVYHNSKHKYDKPTGRIIWIDFTRYELHSLYLKTKGQI